MKYITSPLGIIDLVSILPTFLSVIIPHSQSFMVIRLLRLLRIFRLFKLGSFMKSSKIITQALKESRSKIAVFLFFVILLVTVVGSVMYFIEGSMADSKFTSIPRSIYWAIVTVTTVGYGDIAPVTEIGQFLAAMLMITGYAVIAVPTGIVSAEMVAVKEQDLDTQSCRHCGEEGHADDAIYCHQCGKNINHKEDEDDETHQKE
jgi:voltage-gated potassium channel